MKRHVSAYTEVIIRFTVLALRDANSGGPTEPKDDGPRLGYYIPATRTHIPLLICLGDSSHHISAPSHTHTVFSHIYFVRHDDEISTSATHIIIISLLKPTL